VEPFLAEVNQRIQAALDHLKRDLSTIRAGRANPTLIEELPINVYGGQMKLVELGTISAPQPSLLTIQVWDASVVQDIVKAIQSANLGLNPAIEGQLIRLPIPPLTAERREEFIKLAHQKMEQSRIEVRQIRQEAREEWEQAKDKGEIGEDEFNRRSKLLQELVDKTSGQIDEMGKAKEEELNQI
jgi:ribosome recycling factor